MSKKIKIGDIIEIRTKKGLAYALYTHEYDAPPQYGALLRVFGGFFNERPTDFKEVIKKSVRFSKFFPPLQAAINQGIFEVVGHQEIPRHLKPFPVFRSNNDSKAKAIDDGWWIWDGKKSVRVGKLTNEQQKYPKKGMVNDTALIEMIEGEWGPDEEL